MYKVPFCKTRSTLASELKVARKTFRCMLQRAGIELPPGPIYPPWQKLIYETFTYPEGVPRNAYNDVAMPVEKE